jgi:multisubunit Na+/H+ antiporter MnhB subunit
MSVSFKKSRRLLPLAFGIVTLLAVALLLAWDLAPQRFPARAHDLLGALPLALIALAYMVDQALRRRSPGELFKALLLALAFLFWAANQLWPESSRATLFNDVAIALFVLDVFFAIAGWPASSAGESFPAGLPEPLSREVADEG